MPLGLRCHVKIKLIPESFSMVDQIIVCVRYFVMEG